MKNKIEWFQQGRIFPALVGFCPNEKAFKEFVKTLDLFDGGPEYPRKSAGYCMLLECSKGLFVIIFINGDIGGNTPIETIGIIAHECTHAFRFLCDTYGEDDPSHEFQAYSIQAFVQQCIEAYERTRQKLTI